MSDIYFQNSAYERHSEEEIKNKRKRSERTYSAVFQYFSELFSSFAASKSVGNISQSVMVKTSDKQAAAEEKNKGGKKIII